MYLPLTGFQKLAEKKREAKNVKVDSSTQSVYRAMQPGAAEQVGQQDEANKLDGPAQQNGNPNDNIDGPSMERMNHMSDNMSSQDFVGLHNDFASDMMETVKQVAALRVLEKTLEAINKIMDG